MVGVVNKKITCTKMDGHAFSESIDKSKLVRRTLVRPLFSLVGSVRRSGSAGGFGGIEWERGGCEAPAGDAQP